MFRHQGAIIRQFINKKCLQVQQVSQVLFTLISIITVRSMKMLKLQVTHQQVYVHIAATSSYTGGSLLCGGVVAALCTYT
jgi:molybdopterin-binding protein